MIFSTSVPPFFLSFIHACLPAPCFRSPKLFLFLLPHLGVFLEEFLQEEAGLELHLVHILTLINRSLRHKEESNKRTKTNRKPQERERKKRRMKMEREASIELNLINMVALNHRTLRHKEESIENPKTK